MKKLITLSALALALSIASNSYAKDVINALGVQLPIESTEVRDQVEGDYLSTSANGTHSIFGVQLPVAQTSADYTDASGGDYAEADDNNNYIVVFGVKIPERVS